MRTLVVLLLLCTAATSHAQHCGFDFTYAIVLNVQGGELAGPAESVEIGDTLAPEANHLFWRNLDTVTGYLPGRNFDYNHLFKNHYPFAASGALLFVGDLAPARAVKIVVHRANDATSRWDETYFVAPEYVHPLCTNFTNWDRDTGYETRGFFAPVALDLDRHHPGDTLGADVIPLWTNEVRYTTRDTIVVLHNPATADYRTFMVATDGACQPRVIYGLRKREADEWKDVLSLMRPRLTCGAPIGALPVRYTVPAIAERGEYQIYFRNARGKELATEPFIVE